MPRETRVPVGVGHRGETSVGVEARDWRRFEAMRSVVVVVARVSSGVMRKRPRWSRRARRSSVYPIGTRSVALITVTGITTSVILWKRTVFGSVPEAVLGVRVPSSNDRFLVLKTDHKLSHRSPRSRAYRSNSRCPPPAARRLMTVSYICHDSPASCTARKHAPAESAKHARESSSSLGRSTSRRTSGGRDPKRGPSRSSPSPRGSRPSSFGRGASRMSPRMVSSTEGMRIRRAKESEGLTTCGGGFSELPSWCVQ